MHFLVKGLLLWFLFIPLAVLNGLLRDLPLTPLLGDPAGRAISPVSLALLILGLTRLLIGRLGVGMRGGLLIVGALWLVLSVLFAVAFFAGVRTVFDQAISACGREVPACASRVMRQRTGQQDFP